MFGLMSAFRTSVNTEVDADMYGDARDLEDPMAMLATVEMLREEKKPATRSHERVSAARVCCSSPAKGKRASERHLVLLMKGNGSKGHWCGGPGGGCAKAPRACDVRDHCGPRCDQAAVDSQRRLVSAVREIIQSWS
jgi:hypothetical protein